MGSINRLQDQIDALAERVEKLERDGTPKTTAKRTSTATTGSSTTKTPGDTPTS